MRHVYRLVWAIIGFSMFACTTTKTEQTSEKPQKPNIVLIMADDMGFSDLGFMGSGIETPNLDKLAEGGLVYNQFYNTGRCCPTRASLMTGLYPHNTGLGWMTASNLGHQGYTGDLNKNCATVAELLKEGGYATYLTGKWHLTYDGYQMQESPKDTWPVQRGFDKFYGHLSGGGGYYNPKNLVYNNEWLKVPEDFYLTTAITDSTVSFINQHFREKKDDPFFSYVAYYAPHRPLHALKHDIDKYRGKFMEGWDVLRKKRMKKLLELGIADSTWKLSERPKDIKAWDKLTLDQKKIWDARMAVYAAQMDCLDQGVGKILETLKKNNALDNTLIIFLSDNGGNKEPENRKGDLTIADIDNLGQEFPMASYRHHGANVSNTPFRKYKSSNYEGGVATPLIAFWANGIKAKGTITKQIGHVVDIVPTILDVADVKYPTELNGNKLTPLSGKSLVSNFEGESVEREAIFFEHRANRGIRSGNWKMVSDRIQKPPYTTAWQLYDLSKDRSETVNLADKYPEKVKELAELWDSWAKSNNVYPLDGRGWNQKLKADVLKKVN